MRASRRNWFVRFAYVFGGVPWRTSLCALFWRGVVMMPALLLLAGVFVALVVVQFYMYPLSTLVAILIVVGTIAGIVGALALASFAGDVVSGRRLLPTPLRDSLPVKAIVAAKSKFCPIIDLSEDDDAADEWVRMVESRSSGLRGDPAAPRTVNDDTRGSSSSED